MSEDEHWIVRRYKRQVLVCLLLRGLGRDATEAFERLVEIRRNMTPGEIKAASQWYRALPADLREHGIAVRKEIERASGGALCETCGMELRDHPADPRESFELMVGCDGRIWKL